jgi:hypothetical protein
VRLDGDQVTSNPDDGDASHATAAYIYERSAQRKPGVQPKAGRVPLLQPVQMRGRQVLLPRTRHKRTPWSSDRVGLIASGHVTPVTLRLRTSERLSTGARREGHHRRDGGRRPANSRTRLQPRIRDCSPWGERSSQSVAFSRRTDSARAWAGERSRCISRWHRG